MVKALEPGLQCRWSWAGGLGGIRGEAATLLGKGDKQETLGPGMWESSLGAFMVKFLVEVGKAGFHSAKLHGEQRKPSLMFLLLERITVYYLKARSL